MTLIKLWAIIWFICLLLFLVDNINIDLLFSMALFFISLCICNLFRCLVILYFLSLFNTWLFSNIFLLIIHFNINRFIIFTRLLNFRFYLFNVLISINHNKFTFTFLNSGCLTLVILFFASRLLLFFIRLLFLFPYFFIFKLLLYIFYFCLYMLYQNIMLL